MTAKVAFFDIAGTLVAGNPWNSMTAHPDIDRMRVRVAYAKILPFWLLKKVRLMEDATFRHYWIREMAAVLTGWSQAKCKALFDYIVSEQMAAHDRAPVIARLQKHTQDGEHVVLVSGMFDGIVQAFAERLGANAAIGSKLGFSNGQCTGKIEGSTIGGETKLQAIRDYLTKGFTVGLKDCYAYADSYSDAPMLSAVGQAVATFPDNELRALAAQKQWEIIP